MGKQLRNIITFLTCSFICCNFVINAYAYNEDDDKEFEVDEININLVNESFRNSLNITDVEATNSNIRNFDVDSDGNVLICLCNNIINVYDSSLDFLYSINYNVNGTAIAFWYNKKPTIYLSKSDEIICVDKNGIVNAYKAKDTVENSKIYRNLRGTKSLNRNGYSFKLCYSSSFQKTMLNNPTKLVRINGETEEVIFENKNAWSNVIITIIIVIIFLALFIFIVKIAKNIPKLSIK